MQQLRFSCQMKCFLHYGHKKRENASVWKNLVENRKWKKFHLYELSAKPLKNTSLCFLSSTSIEYAYWCSYTHSNFHKECAAPTQWMKVSWLFSRAFSTCFSKDLGECTIRKVSTVLNEMMPATCHINELTVEKGENLPLRFIALAS